MNSLLLRCCSVCCCGPPACCAFAVQVRQKVLEKLGNVITSVGADVVSASVLPVVAALVSDPQWRVREQVIEQLPLLAQHLGAAVFEERLLALYLSSYHDQVRLGSGRGVGGGGGRRGIPVCGLWFAPRLGD